MFDLKDLASAKKKVTKIRVETSGNAYEDAVKALKEFEQNPDKEILRSASDKLLEALQYKPDHVPSYICIAYIFYVLDESEFALKYINKAESISGKLPEKTLKLKENIINTLPWKKKELENQVTDENDSLY